MSYSPQLAAIHTDHYTFFAEAAARHLLSVWKGEPGYAFDLGCGGGDTSAALAKAGWKVGGVDLSPEMVRRAQERVPGGDFSVGSIYDCEIPPCDVVTAVGEVFNYDFEGGHVVSDLFGPFEMAANALKPGGILMFDVMLASAELDRSASGFKEGDDWAVGVNTVEDKERGVLERNITSFVRAGETWNRTDELHRLVLFDRKELEVSLRVRGYNIEVLDHYHDYTPGAGRAIFVCRR